MESDDVKYMRRALELAEQGRGAVEPNPMVGAVLVKDGQIIGEGWHRIFGEAHAEINALTQAGASAKDATLYVTLEPCCHFGKTPPCSQAVVNAGIRRVVIGMLDPFPKVAGGGRQQLLDSGIEVTVGIEESAAQELNAPYLKFLATGMPYVHAKWAMTLDGKIATRTGHSKWISNATSRQRVHDLRGRMDAIVIGIGTALADDSQLTVRPPGQRIPTRVVVDRHLRIQPESYLVRTAKEIPVWLVCLPGADQEKKRRLTDVGCQIMELPESNLINELLKTMGDQRMTNVLLEGGSALFGAFHDADAIDEYHQFIAPKICGGQQALSPIAGEGSETMDNATPLQILSMEFLDGDIYVRGRRK